jgi:hypothetical protein
MAESGWYYAANGQRVGPVTFDQLRRLTTSGQIAANDLVWTEGMADWQPASGIPSLMPPVPHYQAVQSHYPQPPVGYSYVAQQPVGQSNQGMAIAGFVCSLLFALSPLGLIFSMIALNGMKRTGNEDGKGLAIAGLVIGIVFSTILAIYVFLIATCFGSLLR